MIESKKGFTLVELVIVIVIVGILSIISVPIYRGYVEKAIMTEGKVLINAIGKAELAYHVKNDCFYETDDKVESDSTLDINASGNKYFKEFLTKSGSGRMYFSSSNINAVNKDSYNDEYGCVIIEVYGSNNGKSWTLRAEQYANGALHGFGPNNDIVDENNEVPMLT